MEFIGDGFEWHRLHAAGRHAVLRLREKNRKRGARSRRAAALDAAAMLGDDLLGERDGYAP